MWLFVTLRAVFFLYRWCKCSRKRTKMEGVSPIPSRTNDVQRWSFSVKTVKWAACSGTQNDSWKCPRKSWEEVMSASIFWSIPLAFQREIAILKSRWNKKTCKFVFISIKCKTTEEKILQVIIFLHIEGLLWEPKMYYVGPTICLCLHKIFPFLTT